MTAQIPRQEVASSQDPLDPFARQLQSRYLRRRCDDVANLGKALAENDFDSIRIAGHNMYGSGAAYGFGQITVIGRCLENAAAEGSVVEIRSLIADLEKFIDRQHFA